MELIDRISSLSMMDFPLNSPHIFSFQLTGWKISNFEFRAVIKFLTAEGLNATAIHQRLTGMYASNAPAYSTVAKWQAEFRRGRQSMEDDERIGRPVEVVTDELCNAVEKLVMTDQGYCAVSGHLQGQCSHHLA